MAASVMVAEESRSVPVGAGRLWPRPPSRDEQIELLRRAVVRRKVVDQAAFDELVVRNQRLVVSIAKRYAHKCRHLQFDDLLQIGTMGLMVAIRRFDEKRNNTLSTLATWWIRQSILRGIDDLDAAIRLPVHMHTKLRRCLDQQTGYLRVLQPGESVLQIAQDTRDVLSLDVPTQAGLYVDEPHPVADLLADERANFEDAVIERVGQEQMLDKVIGAAQLSLREGYIVAYRLGIARDADGCAHTLEQVGEKLGVTRERVRQIEKNALVKLRKAALEVGYGEEFGVAMVVRHEYTKVQTRVDVVRVKKQKKAQVVA